MTQEGEERAREGRRSVSALARRSQAGGGVVVAHLQSRFQHCQADWGTSGVKPMVADFDKKQQHRARGRD
jgi:hypothetical protein